MIICISKSQKGQVKPDKAVLWNRCPDPGKSQHSRGNTWYSKLLDKVTKHPWCPACVAWNQNREKDIRIEHIYTSQAAGRGNPLLNSTTEILYLPQPGGSTGEDLIHCLILGLVKARTMHTQKAGLLNNFDTALRSSNQKGKKMSLAGKSGWRPGLQRVPTPWILDSPILLI